jgi:hypothetical protein
MIPPRQKPQRQIDLLDWPRTLAAEFWGGKAPAVLVQQRALDWMRVVKTPIDSADTAIEAIAWAQGLRPLAKILAPDDLQALCELLNRAAEEVSDDVLNRPLLHQLLAGELALTLAKGLPDDKSRRRTEKLGRAAVGLGLGQILDSQGVLPAEHFHVMLPLLACWARCCALAKESAGGVFGLRALKQLDRFVRNVLRIARPDGGLPLKANDLSASARKILEAALPYSAEATNCQIATVAMPPVSRKSRSKPKKSTKLPPASLHCEESALAVLRRGWSRDDERLVTRFAGKSCQIDLASSGGLVMSGEWQFSLSRQGQPLEPVSNWESICWHSDAEVDYLELQIGLTDNIILQRHLVLAREDRFLLMADAVLGSQIGGLEYCGILPLAAGIEFRPAAETREALLIGEGRPLAQVLPLALPEWRSDSRIGQLSTTARGLELRQETDGRRLFAPLFIDLEHSRFRKRLTWRPLTVAESLLTVAADRAAGYRVAISKEQWIIYRSLGPIGNRTLLGHNLSTETLVARFGSDGEVTSIIEIE